MMQMDVRIAYFISQDVLMQLKTVHVEQVLFYRNQDVMSNPCVL